MIALVASLLVAFADASGASASSPPENVSIICSYARLYVFVQGDNRPQLADIPGVREGQRFGVPGPIRVTLESRQFVPLDIPFQNPSSPAIVHHYYVDRACTNA